MKSGTMVRMLGKGGPHSTVDSILASRPAVPGFDSRRSQDFLDVAVIYQQRALLRQWTVQKELNS